MYLWGSSFSQLLVVVWSLHCFILKFSLFFFFHIYLIPIIIFYLHMGGKVSKAPHNKTNCLIKCSRRYIFHGTPDASTFILICRVTRGGRDLQAMVFICWLEDLKSQLDPVIKAVPVGADCSLIYTVPIGSCSCVGLSFSFAVWAFPGTPCTIMQPRMWCCKLNLNFG